MLLENNNITVSVAEEIPQPIGTPSNPKECFCWVASCGTDELNILEVVFTGIEVDRKRELIFMPPRTRAAIQLFVQIRNILIAAGARP